MNAAAGTGTTTKSERAFELARARYELRRDGQEPYALHGGQQYFFRGDRRLLRADLKTAWREKFDGEAPPSDSALNSVLDGLLLEARNADPDQAAADGGQDDDRGIRAVLASAGCPLPTGYVMPVDYVAGRDGVWYLGGRWGRSRVAWAWLFPVCVYVDPDGDQWLELAWRDHGRWISRLARRAITKSGRKLVAEFGDAGLPITDSEARDAEKWIAAAEAANHAVIEQRPVARQLGWQADHATFVTGHDCPWRVEPRYADQAAALAAHQPRGSLARWQETIAAAQAYPVVRAGLYAGLAAPLLVPLGLDSFTVDIAGRSTRGKTITAQVALSCWADPSEKADGIFSWKTKMIGVEKRLNLVCGLPVVIDETRVATSRDLVDAVVYQIPKNRGQARGGGWPNMIPWRTIVISTGEQPATSFTTHQGANARVLSIQQPPFGADGDASRAAAEAVKHGIEDNHGLAGPVFAARLQGLLAEPGGLARLQRRHAELTGAVRGTSDMSGRRAPLIAVLLLAADLAYAWHITPWKAPAPAEWLALFTTDDPRDNRAEMALDVIREHVAAHSDRLWAKHRDARPPAAGWMGRDLPGKGTAILVGEVRDVLARHDYDLDAVKPAWRETGMLLLGDQRPPEQHSIRIAGRPARCLIFPPDHIELDTSEDD